MERKLEVKEIAYSETYNVLVLSINGELYRYFGVSPYIRNKFLKARNKGRILAYIKKYYNVGRVLQGETLI